MTPPLGISRFDGNGDVQFADFLLLSADFGKSATAVAAVLEPNAAMLPSWEWSAWSAGDRVCQKRIDFGGDTF